jgi:predicted nucleic acid-binding protein
MTRFVVDASIAAKWFVPEEYSREALLLHESGATLIAPDILAAEISRFLLKKVRRGEMSIEEARLPLVERLTKAIVLRPFLPLIDDAMDVGLRYQRDTYDALYVVLAAREGCPFVTADQRMYNSLEPDLGGLIQWVGDLPGILNS